MLAFRYLNSRRRFREAGRSLIRSPLLVFPCCLRSMIGPLPTETTRTVIFSTRFCMTLLWPDSIGRYQGWILKPELPCKDRRDCASCCRLPVFLIFMGVIYPFALDA